MRFAPRYEWSAAVFAMPKERLSSNARLVAMAMAERAGAEAPCVVWPSQVRLERMTALSRSSVIRAMSELRELGLIVAVTDKGMSSPDAPPSVQAAARRMVGKDPRQKAYALAVP